MDLRFLLMLREIDVWEFSWRKKKNLAILKVSRQWLLLVVELERESNDVEEATIRKRDNRRRHETSPFLSVTLEFPRMICSAWPIERQSKTLELNNLIYKMRIFITFGWHPGHPSHSHISFQKASKNCTYKTSKKPNLTNFGTILMFFFSYLSENSTLLNQFWQNILKNFLSNWIKKDEFLNKIWTFS